MARITMRQLLDHAAERGYGVPAFNINNMEQGLAILEAAKATDSPVIIQASRGARSYAGDIMLAKMMEALEAMNPAIPICIHQDHGDRVSKDGFTRNSESCFETAAARPPQHEGPVVRPVFAGRRRRPLPP